MLGPSSCICVFIFVHMSPHWPRHASVSFHPSGLFLLVTTATRVYFVGIVRSELTDIADFALVGARKGYFSADGGKFGIIVNKQVRLLALSCRVVSCRVVSCRVVSCRVVSYIMVRYITRSVLLSLLALCHVLQVIVYRSFGPNGPVQLGTVFGHSRPVASFAWTHDDARMVTVGDDGAAIHWDLHK
jgi:hypothetical protein